MLEILDFFINAYSYTEIQLLVQTMKMFSCSYPHYMSKTSHYFLLMNTVRKNLVFCKTISYNFMMEHKYGCSTSELIIH